MIRQVKQIAIYVVLGVSALSAAYQLGKYKQRQEGVIQQLHRDIRDERERVRDDAKMRNLSDYDFCIQSLRRRGLQSADCEQLRGLAAE